MTSPSYFMSALALALALAGCGKKRPADALDDAAVAAAPITTVAAADPEERCVSQAIYARIKTELFDKAAIIRGRDRSQFDKIANYAVLRVDRPILKADDADMGVVTCVAALTLELPPGVEVADGRRSLEADTGYTLQAAADGGGEVVTLTGADPIVVPLATLAAVRLAEAVPPDVPLDPTDPTYDGPGETTNRTPAPPVAVPPPPAVPPPRPAPAPRALPVPMPVPRPATQPRPSARSLPVEPSYNCAQARTRTEHAVCANPALARLDRTMADRYYRALFAANAETGRELRRTRSIFLVNREQCQSDACIAAVYRDRMREVDRIAGAAR